MIAATLVTGATAGQREQAIAREIAHASPSLAPVAVLAEGLPDGRDGNFPQAFAAPMVIVARIAPGCLCCTGNLPMRVTLNRLLQKKPARLFIALADTSHLEQIRAFLAGPPYDARLTLTADLQA